MRFVAGAIAPMTPHAFVKKWKNTKLSERQAAQEHFVDLCALFEHPTPAQDDPLGDHFAFEKGATKIGGGRGFADVWKRDHFAWEYKKKNGDLDAALLQLIRYAPALESPPLQVVCDVEHFRIHTAWTNTVPERYEIKIDDLVDPKQRDILRNVFYDPEKLKPAKTRTAVTKEAADKFSTIALRLQGHGTPEEIAHFVNQLVFCFFADSVKLLPDGLFQKLLRRASEKSERAQKYFNQLFSAMEGGGDFDLSDIAWFNGGLFDGRRALSLDDGDLGLLIAAGSLDWSQIDPSIFGTLFERFLDPHKRAQIGAHYTDQEKILKILEPVILRPLQQEWVVAKKEIEGLLSGAIKPPMRSKPKRVMKRIEAAEEARSRYLERLRKVRILDPACGSGNFLYLALQGVKDIENKVNLECEMLGLEPRLPVIGPEIVRGIEINPLAAELARTTIWIGDIQWRIRNGIHAKPKPILRKLDAIECRDALIGSAKGGEYHEVSWPPADFIIGNPPFLGDKVMVAGLGERYVATLRSVFEERVLGGADLVTYWFEKARASILNGDTQRAGLVATNSIRAGANRKVLERIILDAKVFEAWSDEPWIIDGAAVRVSLVCFGKKHLMDPLRLNGVAVQEINPDLTSGNFDVTCIRPLLENSDIAYIGTQKGGPFEIEGIVARDWLTAPLNTNGRPNADVVRRWCNGLDVVRRPSDTWIVDFGAHMDEAEAAHFEIPFEYIREKVRPSRIGIRRDSHRKYWWRHAEARPGMRAALQNLGRFLVTPRVAKHRVFVWLPKLVVPDTRLVVVARDDDSSFGILNSRFHEHWTLRNCSWHGVGNDPTYNAISCFETFPFPDGLTPNIPASHSAADPRAKVIAVAAKHLDSARNRWLNPSDLVRTEPEIVPGYPDRILPKDVQAAVTLRERTLTSLYNQRPQWLADAHRDLDAAVAAAYGWPPDISDEDALAKLLELNLARADSAAS